MWSFKEFFFSFDNILQTEKEHEEESMDEAEVLKERRNVWEEVRIWNLSLSTASVHIRRMSELTFMPYL